jgi:hypothetical protein
MQNTTNIIKHIHFNLNEFTLNSFQERFIQEFKVNHTYSILIKLSSLELAEFKMIGPQIGYIVSNEHDLSQINNLYSTLIQRIEEYSDLYGMTDSIRMIELIYTSINTPVNKLIKNINKIPLSKQLINVSDTRYNFNSKNLPLSLDIQNYAELVSDKTEILARIRQFSPNLNNVNLNDFIAYVYKGYPTINNIILRKEFNNNIIYYVFNADTAYLIITANDTILNNTTFQRSIANVTLTIKNNSISLLEIKIPLNPLKYKGKHKPLIDRNNNIGTFDVETYINTTTGLACVYGIGFHTTIDSTPHLFYITDPASENDSNKLILNCINQMLISKYHNFIFYSHNFGSYDYVFILNALLKANENIGSEYYILNPCMRDDTPIKLDITICPTINTKIKISIVDSLNLLNKSLAKLARDFEVDTHKGYFPYLFVTEHKFEYIGPIPDIKYFPSLYKNEKYTETDLGIYTQLLTDN